MGLNSKGRMTVQHKKQNTKIDKTKKHKFYKNEHRSNLAYQHIDLEKINIFTLTFMKTSQF